MPVLSGIVLSTPFVGSALSGGNLFNVASVINRMNQTMWTPILPSLNGLQLESRSSAIPRLVEITLGEETIGGKKFPTLDSVSLGLSAPFQSRNLGLTGRTSMEGIPTSLTAQPTSSPFFIENPSISSRFFSNAPLASTSAIDKVFADVRRVSPGDVFNDVKNIKHGVDETTGLQSLSWDFETNNISVSGSGN
jgi:hypothetical protein